VVASPALNDAGISQVANGAYRIVTNYSGEQVAVAGSNFTILYNNRNTFFSPTANFNILATNNDEFFISEQQQNEGTYGVPVSVAAVTPQGSIPGDSVKVEFNGNPNLIAVDNSFVLIDRTGEQFNVISVDDNESLVAAYNNPTDQDSTVTLTDSGADQAVSQMIIADKEVTQAFLNVSFLVGVTSNPSGNLIARIYEDNAGLPGAVIATSNPLDISLIPSVGFNFVNFIFATELSLTKGQFYHIAIEGDSAYKLSYANLDGSIEVAKDSSSPAYFPATTASGNIIVNSANNITLSGTASATLEVKNNFIRSMTLAKGAITILENTFSGGEHRIIIGGISLKAVTSTPGPNEFEVGATIYDTRDNLKAAIDTFCAGLVNTTNVGSDSIELTAVSPLYRGEAGNSITLAALDPGVATFNLSGSTLEAGIDGDKVIVTNYAFVNNSQVNYTYNPISGLIQFLAPVSLPTFQSGDVFVDGAGIEFNIASINDALNQLVISPSLTVQTNVDTEKSGSIKRVTTLEFGFTPSLTLGVTAAATATNLNTVLNAITGLTTSVTGAIVTLISDFSGVLGNENKIEFEDITPPNFESTEFSGGLDADSITVDGVKLTFVAAAPGPNEILYTNILTNLLANIQNAISLNVSSVIATVSGNQITVAATVVGSAGNLITLDVDQTVGDNILISGDFLQGGSDNLLAAQFNGTNWNLLVPDSDLIFQVAISADTIFVISKANAQGQQIIPQLSSGGGIDSSLGKRYYSDNNEVSFLIATKSPNAFIIGASDSNLYGLGTVGGNPNTRVDHFIFRTSRFEDDVVNLRASEIPVLKPENININLLGGVN
jgi:hypothetical protein